MGEAQELQLHIMVPEAKEAISPENANATHQSTPPRLKYKRWLRMALFAFFLLAGQSVATLLGRLYYDKGGKSKWMSTLVQVVGFPILLPCFFIKLPKNPPANDIQTKQPSVLILASIYVSIGLILAAYCMLYSIGLLYLPVSTYSLICASQLAFNAFFSFFLNSQKFTPFIVNSLVLLTMSSTLLVFQPDDSDNPTGVSKAKYAIGFLSTVGASAGYALSLSLTQLAFCKVLKRQTFTVILNMIIYPEFVATCATLVGLFASGEWKSLKTEMQEYSLGNVSYMMTLIWIAVSWQLCSIGAVGLIFEVSSLFCNVISTLGLPIVPVFAVVFFHDKMNGVKVVAMILAIWGFLSYIYQHYIDDCKSKTKTENVDEVSKASPTERS